MPIIHVDMDVDLENRIRAMHRALQDPRVTLRALRCALWSLGLEAPLGAVRARCDANARTLGRPSAHSVVDRTAPEMDAKTRSSLVAEMNRKLYFGTKNAKAEIIPKEKPSKKPASK
jgi:hypothetical protein